MTKEQFIKFISEFNKRPGEYTEEEIFKIGCAHKEIQPTKSRSWEYVKNVVGWPGSSNSLRMFINYKLKKDLEKATTGADEYQEKLNQLYIEKTKVRDLRNSFTRGLREEARIEALKETLKNTVDQLNSLPKMCYTSKHTDEKTEAILMLSDLHIGVSCDNFYNTYNVDVATKRLSKLASDVIYYCKLYDVYKLNVVNLGDLIHGLIHTNARVEEQTDAITQVMIAGELISQFLNTISQAAEIITYRSCSDNHSRTIANKNEAIENENFGRLID